jgi:hypothetical protein
MKKVGRIVERQNLKQENRALKNILQHVEVVVKAQRMLEEAFQRGLQAGRASVLAEQAEALRAKNADVGIIPAEGGMA